MDSIYGEQEEYLGKFGELFLTIKGNFAFHCTLCEDRFKGFQDYIDHILETHYAPDFKKDVSTDSHEEEDKFDPLNEETYSYDYEDHGENDENKDESSCSSPQHLNQVDEHKCEEPVMQEDADNPGIQDKSYESPQHLNQVNEQVNDILQDDFKNKEQNSSISNNIKPVEAIRSTIRCINLKPTIIDRKFQCPYCDFKGADRSNIRKHISRHSLNKPHKCKECDKAFYTRTELKSHCRLHTGERPFLCNLCGKSFISSGTLTEHEKRHTNTRDKECPVCKITFINKKALCKHMVVHSDKREYKCTLCDATFKLAESLRNHMKLHENKREYECKLCDSKFNQHAGLYSHMKSCHMIVLISTKAS